MCAGEGPVRTTVSGRAEALVFYRRSWLLLLKLFTPVITHFPVPLVSFYSYKLHTIAETAASVIDHIFQSQVRHKKNSV